jgi:hypothetical protein
MAVLHTPTSCWPSRSTATIPKNQKLCKFNAIAAISAADTRITKSYLSHPRREAIWRSSHRTLPNGGESRMKKETNMHGRISVLGSIAALALGSVITLSQPAAAADGCGPAGYRGPGGACHRFGFGPYPGGYHGPNRNAYRWNGCPAGYWRGPWGHCRDTPYHGRLPDGSWKS